MMNTKITPIIPALLIAAIGFSAPTLTSSSRRMYTPDPRSMDIVDDDDGIPRLGIRGFAEEERKTGSVPYANSDSDKVLAWADPPDGVTSDAPKVLTFDGSTVTWGDDAGGTGTNTVEVVVGIEFQLSSSSLEYRLKTRKIYAKFADEQEQIGEWDEVFGLSNETVTHGVRYDTTNHKMYQQRSDAYLISPGQKNEDEVFEAVPMEY